MKQGKEFKFKKIVLCLCILIAASLPASAYSNSLTGIDVKQTSTDGYNVVLKLAKNTDIKKVVSSNDTITLMLKSTIPSEALEIVYDNTSHINNVIVQKKNADNTMVVLEGKNISNADIYTKDISTGAVNLLNSNKSFFGIYKNLLTIPASLVFICVLFMLMFKPKNKKLNSNNNVLKNRTLGHTLRTSSISRSNTTPSIAYNTQHCYTSAPKDFIINRYLEDEKIRKAG